jgi:hypothetical protein
MRATFFRVLLVLAGISLLALITWFLFFPKWVKVVSDDSPWQYAFVSDTLTSAFPDTLMDGDLNITFSEEDWKTGHLLLRNSFHVRDIAKVLKGILYLDSKYDARVLLNGKQLVYKDRYLIEPESENPNPGKVTYQASWRKRRIFLSHDELQEALKNGTNRIELLLSDKYGRGLATPGNIGLHLFVQGVSSGPFALPRSLITDHAFVESKLPIFRIDVPSGVIPDEPKTAADLLIIEGNTVNRITDSGRALPIRIERRGNSTQRMAKRSYTLSVAEPQDLLGLPASKKWVLYGPYIDRSLIRNALAYSLYRQMGQPAPAFRYLELVINNNYRGIYMLVEKVQLGMDRMVVPPLKQDSTGLHGAYLLEIDRNGIKSPYPLSNDSEFEHLYYSINQPKWARKNGYAKQLIMDQYREFERRLFERKDYLEVIDMDSFIDYLIITEFCKNVDGYRLSTFLLNPDIADSIPRFRIGPIWDFNLTFGLSYLKEGHSAEGLVCQYDRTIPFWWNTLFNEQRFRNRLITRYEQLRQGTLSEANVRQTMDSTLSLFSGSMDNNFRKWEIFGVHDFWPNYHHTGSHDEEITLMSDWISDRFKFLDDHFLTGGPSAENVTESSDR